MAGRWRGRSLLAPRSDATRPTADRVRQALFDMLGHASWAYSWPECPVLDAFAGTGALGLEALSRGAPSAVFFETGRAAQSILHANIAALEAAARVTVLGDAVQPPFAPAALAACRIVFLDPPYGAGLMARALDALGRRGWIASDALIVAETARDEDPPIGDGALLAQRRHGAARLSIWRARSPS